MLAIHLSPSLGTVSFKQWYRIQGLIQCELVLKVFLKIEGIWFPFGTFNSCLLCEALVNPESFVGTMQLLGAVVV
jgi:hypothetical protein